MPVFLIGRRSIESLDIRMKTCIRCGIEKDESGFYIQRGGGRPDRLKPRCKLCLRLDGQTRSVHINSGKLGICKVTGCNKPVFRKYSGLCCMHHWRLIKYNDPGEPGRRKAHNGAGWDSTDGYRGCSQNGVSRYVHRIVMEEYLGRPLLKSENVHHINGDRQDNRIENLEIWNTLQPSGQRWFDKVAYAKEILELYAPLISKRSESEPRPPKIESMDDNQT